MFFTPQQDMQKPTHARLHVRDARDAQAVFEAVRLGRLQPVGRRLNDTERSLHVRSGSVFVWEESDDELGLKRWTDGRFWSQSRMREPFLFYEEKLPEEKKKERELAQSQPPRPAGTPRGTPTTPASTSQSSASAYPQRERATHPAGLVKQAYSAWVTLPGDSKRRKWHLTAYLTYLDLATLPTPDQDPILSRISIPQGIYRSGKARQSTRASEFEGEAPSSSSRVTSASPTASPTYTHYPQSSWGPASPPPSHQHPGIVPAGFPPQHTHVPHQPGMPYPGPPYDPTIGDAAMQHHMQYAQPPSVDPSQQSQYDRSAEDRRLINMLNSRHIM